MSDSKWRCPYCDALNHWQDEVCQVCGDGRREEAAPPAGEEAPRPADVREPDPGPSDRRASAPPPPEPEYAPPLETPPEPVFTPFATPPAPKKKRGGLLRLLLVILALAAAYVVASEYAYRNELNARFGGGPAPAATGFTWPTAVPTAPSENYVELREGVAGPYVLRLQKELAQAGYYDGPLNGQYDSDTRYAVERVQREHGLPVTGIADPTTQEFIHYYIVYRSGN